MRSKYTHQHLQQEEQHNHHHQQRSNFLPMLCSSSTKQVIKLSHRRSSSTSSSCSSTVSDDPLSPRVGCMGQVKRNNKVAGFPSRSFVSGFTTTTTSATCTNNNKSDQISNYSSNSIVKYHKLKRFFSTKSLTSSPTTTIAATATAVIPRGGTHKGKINAGRNSNSSIGSAVNNNKSRGIRANCTVRDDHGVMIPRSKVSENCAQGTANNNNNENSYNGNDKGCMVSLLELDPPLPVVKQQQQQGNNGENMSLWKRRSGGAPLKSLQLQVTQQSCSLLLAEASTV